MQWASLRAARNVCGKARLHSLASSFRPGTALARDNFRPVTFTSPPRNFLSWRSISVSRIRPFSKPHFKSNHTAHEDQEEDYFKHLVHLHGRLQQPDEAIRSSDPPLPPSHDTLPSDLYNCTSHQPPPQPCLFILRPPSSQLIKTHLPPKQCAIAAAQAIRVACRDNTLADAEYILHSLIYSNIPDAPDTVGLELPVLGSFEFIPIRFERPVSPRLAAHSLLHHYLRHGNVLKAKTTAERLMQHRVRIRGETLAMIATALLQAPPTTFDVLREGGKIMLHQMDVIGDGDLLVKPEMIRNDGARFALVLLLKARENGQRNSDRLLERFASLCLLNGEILLGAILFALIAKDFELRWQRAQALKAKIAKEEASPGVSPESQQCVVQAATGVLRIPPMRLVKSIVRQCSDGISVEDEVRRAEAYQALAYLASLVDSRSLPYSDVSTLLKALYSCPRDSYGVWVAQRGRLELVGAYQYFHRVLLRLGVYPPTKGQVMPNGSGPPVMPQLSRETYNTLVYYALRHRLSLQFARKILRHMELQRSPGLEPDITTYNIFLRCGTLMRRNDVVSYALEELRMAKENNRHGIMVLPQAPGAPGDPPGRQVPPPKPAKTRYKPKRMPLSRFLRIQPPDQPLAADGVTLASYILHLTSSGSPKTVYDVLWYILPEMSIVDHPAWDNVTPQQRATMVEQSRQKRLDRAVALGPWFFTNVLNALCKSGRTGLAERVWLLAKQAERASWLETIGNGQRRVVEGWCLPVHAYTIMLQVYNKEARKGVSPHSGKHSKTRWSPCSSNKARNGWAQYVAYRNRVTDEPLSRRRRALRMGVVHFRSMWRAAQDIYDTLTEFDPDCLPQVELLRPDERFFNAALNMFGRQSAMIRRSLRTSPSYWRRLERYAMLRYSRFGVTPRNWNPFLKRVVAEMLKTGFPVPIAFRRLFLDTWLHPSFDAPHRAPQQRQPYMFPKMKKLRPLSHALPTHKTRGLPVSRRSWYRTLGRNARKWRQKRVRREWTRHRWSYRRRKSDVDGVQIA